MYLRYQQRNGHFGILDSGNFSHFTRWARDDVGFINTKTGNQIEITNCAQFEIEMQKLITTSSINKNPFCTGQDQVYAEGDESWRIYDTKLAIDNDCNLKTTDEGA